MAKPDPITTDDAAETASIAAMKFEPWDRPLSITAEHWQQRLLAVNVALAVMTKSKAELIAGLGLDDAHEAILEALNDIADVANQLRNLADALLSARARLEVALAAVAAQPH